MLAESYPEQHPPAEPEIADLATYHHAATSYLDADTRRQLMTAKTHLQKALSGIEDTAERRVDGE